MICDSRFDNVLQVAIHDNNAVGVLEVLSDMLTDKAVVFNIPSCCIVIYPPTRCMLVLLRESVQDGFPIWNYIKSLCLQYGILCIYSSVVREEFKLVLAHSRFTVVDTMVCEPKNYNITPTKIPSSMFMSVANNILYEVGVSHKHPIANMVRQEVYARMFHSDYYGIFKEGTIASQLYFTELLSHGFIKGILTQRNYRHRGLARQLLEGVSSTSSKSSKTLCLNVESDNHIAISLYKSIGFHKVGSVYCYSK